MKNWKKTIGKVTPFNRENGILEHVQKSLISYGARFPQPKYHIPSESSLEPKIY